MSKKIIIQLSSEQRRTLVPLVRTGTHSAFARTRTQMLLKTDADGPDPWSDERIAEAFSVNRMTVSRMRR